MSFRQSVCWAALLIASAACSKKEPPRAEAESGAAATGGAPVAADASQGAKQQSVGRQHLPQGCELVALVDWQRFRKLESVKGDLERAVKELEQSTIEEDKAAAEFLKKTGIDPLEDPGEIAVCAWRLEQTKQDATPSFVAIVGGKFRLSLDVLDTLASRIRTAIQGAQDAASGQQATKYETIQVGGVKTLHDPKSGLLIAQAKNGAFVIGNERTQFERALTPSDAHKEYKFSPEPIGVSLTKASSKFLGQALVGTPFAAAAGSFTGAHLGFNDRLMRMEAHFEDEKHTKQLEQGARALLANLPPTATDGSKVEAKGKILSIELPVPEKPMDTMFQQMPLGGLTLP